MTGAQVKDLQRGLNTFTNRYLKYVTPLIVDGENGQATEKRVRAVKYYLGYPAGERDSIAGERFRYRMHHPRRPWASNLTWQARGVRRRVRQRRLARAEHKKLAALAAQHKTGFGTFDGKVVAAWMIPWLQKSRRAGWRGTVVSGVRTPAYSEHLCIVMCNHPTCPGRCAGRGSNHNMLPSQGEPHGALDVTDYANFGRIQHRIGSPLRNALPNDRVHYSVSGR